MTTIRVYDTEAEIIEELCDKYDVTEAELMDYIDELKACHGWK